MMKRCCSSTAFARSASSTVRMPLEIASVRMPGVFSRRPAPNLASVSRRNFFFSSEAMSHCRHCARLKHAASPEPRIWMRSAYTVNFRWVHELHLLKQPRGDGCLKGFRLARIFHFLYYLFGNHEIIRRQFSEQIESANVNEINKDVRVGHDDTNRRGTWWGHPYSGRRTDCASASSIPAFTRRSCAIH